MKKFDYSEIITLKRLADQITLAQFGTGNYVIESPTSEDTAAAHRGLDQLSEAMTSGQYDMIIADEANVAVALGLIEEREILALIGKRPVTIELVLTGRGATPAIIAAADLVTEMKPVKHYYNAGVTARRGIES